LVSVCRGCIGHRADVEHQVQRRLGIEEGLQSIRLKQARWGVLREVPPLALFAEPVDHYGFRPPLRQSRVQVRADEPGTAGYHDHPGRALLISRSVERTVLLYWHLARKWMVPETHS
jgi:hypothetical protein